MDVWLHGSALFALWVIAACMVLLLLTVWIALSRLSDGVKGRGTTNAPVQPEG